MKLETVCPDCGNSIEVELKLNKMEFGDEPNGEDGDGTTDTGVEGLESTPLVCNNHVVINL